MSAREFYVPKPHRTLLLLAAVLAVVWIASASDLRVVARDAGMPAWLVGSFPSAAAATCCSAWIAGSQGTTLRLAALLGFAVSASAEIIQLVGPGHPDTLDVLGAALGAVTAFPLMALARGEGRL